MYTTNQSESTMMLTKVCPTPPGDGRSDAVTRPSKYENLPRFHQCYPMFVSANCKCRRTAARRRDKEASLGACTTKTEVTSLSAGEIPLPMSVSNSHKTPSVELACFRSVTAQLDMKSVHSPYAEYFLKPRYHSEHFPIQGTSSQIYTARKVFIKVT